MKRGFASIFIVPVLFTELQLAFGRMAEGFAELAASSRHFGEI